MDAHRTYWLIDDSRHGEDNGRCLRLQSFDRQRSNCCGSCTTGVARQT